ncbi:hypothetical protein AAC387_Pa07g1184 [Persea americana]
MLELKHHILDHLCWPVGNREAIDAFQDLWIPGAGPKGCLRTAPSIFIASVISSPGTRATTLAGTNNSSPAGRWVIWWRGSAPSLWADRILLARRMKRQEAAQPNHSTSM